MSSARLNTWLAEPMPANVQAAIERLRRAPDVQQIAVMPDVHLAADVCIGVALATPNTLYPQAVGGDIGCGMLAVAVDAEAERLLDAKFAGRILAAIGQAVPARRRTRNATFVTPPSEPLSDPALESIRRNAAALEFATLGGGNHFIELQQDEEGRLWLMVHSGSRILGQSIRDHHLARARPAGSGLRALDAGSAEGQAYRHDAAYARAWAAASREAMAAEVGRVLSARLCWETRIHSDHNHVAREHDQWVHRKGAMSAHDGEPGVLPGSMGTVSFHVEGRGHAPALNSSAHGAGRRLSRTEARARISDCEFERQMQGVWFDSRLTARLRDEAPGAYKDIRAVLRAQRDLVKVVRTLKPVLNYKGG